VPTITSIKQQKNKNRVNVYLDDKFSFGIDLDNFVLLGLRVGQELTEKEIEEIVKKAEFQKALDKTYRFAMVRPRSEKEVLDYLKRKKYHILIYDKLLEKLKYFDLLDDFKFAKWWVEQRLLLGKKSKRVIEQELLQKGINRNTIEDVLGETKIDEEKMAKELVEKRMYRWEKLDPKLRRQKIAQYLVGKGFGWEIIEKVV